MSGKFRKYKGYNGSIEFDAESGDWHGRLMDISDIIAYASETEDGLLAAFREAVDEYLEDCKEFGKQPDKPCPAPKLRHTVLRSTGRKNVTLGKGVGLQVVRLNPSLLGTVPHLNSTYVHPSTNQWALTNSAIPVFRKGPEVAYAC